MERERKSRGKQNKGKKRISPWQKRENKNKNKRVGFKDHPMGNKVESKKTVGESQRR